MTRVLRTLSPLLLLAVGCSVSPPGEAAERERATLAGPAFAAAWSERELPPLGPEARLADWLAHAERANGDLEAAWQRWWAALEQVPQAGTQDTTAMLGLEHRLDGGSALDRTGLMLMSDAMANLLLPGRLEARAAAALARARVAAAEFDRARLTLQRDVTAAWWALALRDEELRLLRGLRGVRSMQAAAARAAVVGGGRPQQAQLAAEVALLRLDARVAALGSGRPALAAALRAPAGVPAHGATPQPAFGAFAVLHADERQWLEQALVRAPALEVARAAHAAALAEVTAREWLRVPEFSLRSLLMGDGAATVAGAASLPFLRGDAIEAAVREAEASVRAAAALRRQAGSDAVAAVLAETATLDALAGERDLLRDRVLPLLEQAATVARAEWSAGAGEVDAWAEAEALRVAIVTEIARLDAAGHVARARLAFAAGVP